MTSKFRSIAIVSILLLTTGILLWYTFSTLNQEPVQIFPAAIKRDCAPWDGSAFMVSIPVNGSVIDVSIYQSPEIKHRTTFSFPDESGHVGNAFLLRKTNSLEQLSGEVSFQSVQEGHSVEGQFVLATIADEHFKGKFIAGWGNEIVYCG